MSTNGADDDTGPDRALMLWIAGYLLGIHLVGYLAYAGILALFSSEGAVPPSWRDPDVPAGAEIVSVGERCASGGCWREIVVRPSAGQGVDDLAAEMGLTPSQTYGWRWYDPAGVSVHAADPRGEGLLEVSVSYVHTVGG